MPLVKSLFILTLLVNLCLTNPLPQLQKNYSTKVNLIEKLHKFDQREREEIVNKLKMHNLSDIEPQKHIDAVPIESDGTFNRDMHKELFLADHEELDSLNEGKVVEKLTDVFKKLVKS